MAERAAAMELLEPVLVKDADPKKQHFFAFGDEWIVSDNVQGPCRLYGNHLEPLLRKDEAAFGYVAGSDRRGRWLFRKSIDSPETLILDPTLPDPTPRLPVWLMCITKGKAGWNKENFPVIKQKGAWVLLVRKLAAAEAGDRSAIMVRPRLTTTASAALLRVCGGEPILRRSDRDSHNRSRERKLPGRSPPSRRAKASRH